MSMGIGMGYWEIVLTVIGLAVITVLTRSFFLLPERELPIPKWLNEALRHAPLAALVAVVAVMAGATVPATQAVHTR